MSTQEKEISTDRYALFYTPLAEPKSLMLRQHLRIAGQQRYIEESENALAELREQRKTAEHSLESNQLRKAALEVSLAKVKADLKIAMEPTNDPIKQESKERDAREIRSYIQDYMIEIQRRERRIKEFTDDIAAIDLDIKAEEKSLEQKKKALDSLQSTLKKIESDQALISKQAALRTMSVQVGENVRDFFNTSQIPTLK